MTEDDASTHAVVIERSFDAPVELIWRMWTEPEHVKAWYGPGGATVPVATLDVRVGGRRLVGMEMVGPDRPRRMWFSGEYREVEPHRRLVYTEALADEDGNPLRPGELGLPDGYPVTTQVIVELEDLGGRTRMLMRHVGIPEDSPGAAGWAMALDRLAVHVKAAGVR